MKTDLPVRVVLVSLWLAFVAYAFLGGPPETQTPDQLIGTFKDLATFRGEPLVVALFNLMGLIPLAYFFLLVPDGHGEKLRAWPFGLASLVVGAFALLPYLFLRRPHSDWPRSGRTGRALRLFDSRLFAAGVAVAIAALLFYGLTQGNWSDFGETWRTSRFVHVMGLDFLLSVLLLPVLITDDMRRRKLPPERFFGWVSLVPLLGPLAYLVLRPPLPSKSV